MEFRFELSAVPISELRPELRYGGKVCVANAGPEDRVWHCGPLDWTADEGKVYVPDVMLHALSLVPSDMVTMRLKTLPLGDSVTFKPKTSAFLQEISNPRAVLETELRMHATLTIGQTILFSYNDSEYQLDVTDVGPASEHRAINIIEADVAVTFETPDDYVEPSAARSASLHDMEPDGLYDDDDNIALHAGRGNRLSGAQSPSPYFQAGRTSDSRSRLGQTLGSSKQFVPFSGQGHRLSSLPLQDQKEAQRAPGDQG